MTEKSMNKKYIIIPIVYYLCLYGVWAAYTLLLKPLICDALGEETFTSSFLRRGVLKNLVWTLPAAFLIIKYKEHCLVSLKDMFTKIAPGWKGYLVIFPCFLMFVIVSAWRTHGGLAIAETFTIDDVITVLFVGITEELVFRGWLLNYSVREDSSKKEQYIAVAVNAVMFLCIHFPIWISKGQFISSFASLGFVSIIVLSVIFSIAFIRTKNIVLPIALHMFWDLLVFMLI